MTRKARIAYYLAWLPMAALVVVILNQRGLSVLAAIVAGVVLSAPFSLVCGYTYFMCRAMPLHRARLLEVLPRLLIASLGAGGAWAAVAYGAGQIIGGELGGQLANQGWVLFGVGVTFFALSLAFHYLVLGLENVHRAERAADEAVVLSREAELRALRAQLDPHFLFNSLNSIAALTTLNPSGARDMCRELSSFFRETLRFGDRTSVRLKEELSLIRGYLAIEQVRFEERLKVSEDVDDGCTDLLLPPLTLQPLVENAVKHGAAHRLEETVVELRVRKEGEEVVVSVTNPVDADAPSSGGVGRGIGIVKERIRSFYGPAARMVVDQKDDVFRATLRLPVSAMETTE